MIPFFPYPLYRFSLDSEASLPEKQSKQWLLLTKKKLDQHLKYVITQLRNIRRVPKLLILQRGV